MVKFQRSALGAFLRSPLGQRNRFRKKIVQSLIEGDYRKIRNLIQSSIEMDYRIIRDMLQSTVDIDYIKVLDKLQSTIEIDYAILLDQIQSTLEIDYKALKAKVQSTISAEYKIIRQLIQSTIDVDYLEYLPLPTCIKVWCIDGYYSTEPWIVPLVNQIGSSPNFRWVNIEDFYKLNTITYTSSKLLKETVSGLASWVSLNLTYNIPNNTLDSSITFTPRTSYAYPSKAVNYTNAKYKLLSGNTFDDFGFRFEPSSTLSLNPYLLLNDDEYTYETDALTNIKTFTLFGGATYDVNKVTTSISDLGFDTDNGKILLGSNAIARFLTLYSEGISYTFDINYDTITPNNPPNPLGSTGFNFSLTCTNFYDMDFTVSHLNQTFGGMSKCTIVSFQGQGLTTPTHFLGSGQATLSFNFTAVNNDLEVSWTLVDGTNTLNGSGLIGYPNPPITRLQEVEWLVGASDLDLGLNLGFDFDFTMTDTNLRNIDAPCFDVNYPTINYIDDNLNIKWYLDLNKSVTIEPELTHPNEVYAYELYSGVLPVGLSLNQSTGLISGTPTVLENTSSCSLLVTNTVTGQRKVIRLTWRVQ